MLGVQGHFIGFSRSNLFFSRSNTLFCFRFLFILSFHVKRSFPWLITIIMVTPAIRTMKLIRLRSQLNQSLSKPNWRKPGCLNDCRECTTCTPSVDNLGLQPWWSFWGYYLRQPQQPSKPCLAYIENCLSFPNLLRRCFRCNPFIIADYG